MNYSTKLRIINLTFVLIFTMVLRLGQAQYCDSLVPSFAVDLSASPIMNWLSAPVIRDGNCCGTTNPDNCLEFIITLHPSAIAVDFNIASGAIPPGALFYQIDCGPATAVGSPICLTGPGPHHLTFCKPGNNTNTFSINSYSSPVIGPDITLNAGCQGFIYGNYYDETTVSWTSIAPGAVGAYDNLLSCTNGCDTAYVTAPIIGPAFVDYLVCGMDAGGCNPNPICDTVRVNFIASVVASISSLQDSLCAGQTTTISVSSSGGTAPYSYVWSTAETSTSINVGPGTYYVDVVDISGCHVAIDSITIIQNALPAVVAGLNQQACAGTAITLSGSGALLYTWDNGITNNVPFGQGVGTLTYTLIGTDANGCVNSDQVDVTIFPLPIVNGGFDQILCAGSAATLSGSGASSYIWDQGVTDGFPFIPSVGSLNYNVIGTDLNGCSASDQVTITVNPLPLINAGMDMIICDGAAVQLNGVGANSYIWDNGVLNGVSFNPTVGTLIYTVVGTDMNGCQNQDQMQITVNALPSVNAGPDYIVCEGTPVTLIASGAQSYSWDNGVIDGVPFVQSVGTVTYTVMGTDINGCVNFDQAKVKVNPNPVVEAGPDQTVCFGSPVMLSATGSSNLNWNNGVVNNTPFQQGLGVIVYIVQDSLSTGCTASDSLRVEVLPVPNVSTNDAEICEGDPVTLIGSGADSYTWSPSIINGIDFYPSSSQLYTVTGTSLNGCSSQAIAALVVHPAPKASFVILNNDLNTLNSTTGFVNYSTGAVSYNWDFGDGSANSSLFEPVHTFPSDNSATYGITLTVISDYGCIDEVVQFVQIEQDYSIYVPNAFTPNNSGINDIFKPILTGFDEYDFTMTIFNRWGDMVFESHNMEVGWDGTFAKQNYEVQDGVFTWKIVAGLKDSAESKVYVGHVSLIK